MDSESCTCLPAHTPVIGVDAKNDKPILCVCVNVFDHVSITHKYQLQSRCSRQVRAGGERGKEEDEGE